MKRYAIVILLIFFYLPKILLSSHLAGGYIQYTHVTKNKYAVSVHTYRDCRGILFDSYIALTVSFYDKNGSSIGADTIKATRIGIVDNSFRCSYSSAACSPQNTNNNGQGIEKHTYFVEVDLESSKFKTYFQNTSLCEIVFAWDAGFSRSSNISTISTGQNFYIQSTMRLCNSSGSKISWINSNPYPLFDKPEKYCCNMKQNLLISGIDTIDFDSLSFRLTPARHSSNTNVSYTSPFRYNKPLTPYCPSTSGITCTPKPNIANPEGFYFDSLTGIATFIPTSCSEVAIIAVEFQEFRKYNGAWVLIGKSIMDRIFYTDAGCPTNYCPTLQVKSNDEIALGNSYHQNIFSKDDTGSLTKILDTTTVKILNLPGGAAYSRNTPFKNYDSGYFNWNPTSKWLDKTYKLYVGVFDNKCALPAYEIKVLQLKIRSPRTKYTIRTYFDKNGNCKRDAGEYYVGNLRFALQADSLDGAIYLETNDTGYVQKTISRGPRKLVFFPKEKYTYECGSLQLDHFKSDTNLTLEIPVKRRTYITGTFFNDFDGDCSGKHISDRPIPNTCVRSNTGISTWTSDKGSFILFCDTGTYSLNLPDFPSLDSCGTATRLSNITVLKDSFADLGDLAISNAICDIGVTMNADRFIRGGAAQVRMSLYNFGSVSLKQHTSGNFPRFYLSYEKKLTLKSCSGCSSDTAKALLFWNLGDIENGAVYTCSADFNIPTSKNATGDNIYLSSYLDTSFSDSNNSNNAAGLRKIVRGAFEANKKLSESADSGVCSEPIVYRIDFQNLGSDTVYDVLITDTMDSRYDISTIRPIAYSSDFVLSTKDSLVQFLFRNHKLTDSVSNLSGSKGFAIFSVKLKDGFDSRIEISNKAYIQYDYKNSQRTNEHLFKTRPYTEILSLDKSKYCGETNVKITYRINYASTISRIRLELSDSSGSFKNPLIIKQFLHPPSPGTKTMDILLPTDLPQSQNYLLRFVPMDPDSSTFVVPSKFFEVLRSRANFAFNKSEYCDKDSIYIDVNLAKEHSIYFNNILLKSKVPNGKYYIGLSNLVKNEIKIVSTDSNNCSKTRINLLKTNPTPAIDAVLQSDVICQDSFSKLILKGPDKYTISWKGTNIFDTIPEGTYNVPGDAKADSFLILATSIKGCKIAEKIASPVYEAPGFWAVKIRDTMVCRGRATKLSFSGHNRFDVFVDSQLIYNNVTAGSYDLYVLKSQETVVVTGYSNRNCPYIKTVKSSKINNPYNFKYTLSDDTICVGTRTTLLLKDRNYFDIFKENNLIYPAHDSSAITLPGDTIGELLTIIGKTPFGCLDTQYTTTPVLDNWMPYSATVSDSLLCKGDSTKLTLSGRPKFNVFLNQQAVYSLVGPATYKLPADTVVRKYEIHAISPIGCIDTAIVSGAREEQFFPKLSGSLAIPPFCDGDSIEITYTGSPLCDLLNHNQAISTLMHNETKKISVPASKGVLLQSRFTSDLGCLYTSNVLSYKSNTIPPKPVISRQGDTLFSSATYYNNWYYYRGQRTGLKDTASRFIPDSNAAYFVKVVEPSGCYNQSDTIQFQKKINSLYSPQNGSVISLNPNPFSESLRVRSADPIESVHVHTLDGRSVPLNLQRISSTDYEILLLDATSGVYVAEIVTNNSAVFRRKIIKIVD